ncbi:transposase [uncultured Nostoc sp.]|uniref:transposase n=1 Tax=uncultured Nostoc sp. TaxID=340711 RepID=UPI0035CA7A8C
MVVSLPLNVLICCRGQDIEPYARILAEYVNFEMNVLVLCTSRFAGRVFCQELQRLGIAKEQLPVVADVNNTPFVSRSNTEDRVKISTLTNKFFMAAQTGFRTQQVSLITTLLDKATYSTLAIVGLYGQRWDVELDLRHLKTTLGMDVLRCKTPPMVRKEIYVYLLAYNLLRSLMWSAVTTYTTPPTRLFLQGTRHHLINFIPKLLAASSQKRLQIYRNEA